MASHGLSHLIYPFVLQRYFPLRRSEETGSGRVRGTCKAIGNPGLMLKSTLPTDLHGIPSRRLSMALAAPGSMMPGPYADET